MSDGASITVTDVVRVLVAGESRQLEESAAALEATLSGGSVLWAQTEAEALEILDAREVHCVVCDPQAGQEHDDADTELLERIRKRAPSVPIVAIAATEAASEVIDAGATDVLEPGAPRTVVLARVGTAAERYRLVSDLDRSRGYQAILDHSSAPVMVLDADATVRYANAAAEDVLGYTRDELERRPSDRFVHPDDSAAVERAFEGAVSDGIGGRSRVRGRVHHVDGTWHRSELTYVNRLPDPAIGGVVLTVNEATAIDPNDAQVGRALDQLDFPFLSLGPTWEITVANDAAARLVDYPAEHLVGTVFWELLPDTVKGPIYERAIEAVETDSTLEFEMEYPSLDGRLRIWIAPDESGVSVLARERTGTDSIALAERLSHLESILDALDVGVFVLEDSTITRSNATVFELTGADTIVGRDLDAIFDDDLATAIADRARSTLVRRMDALEGTVETSGGSRPVTVTVTPLPGDERVVCVVRDGTERRSVTELIETLERTTRGLREAETRPTICQLVVDGIFDALDVELVGGYFVDGAELRPAALAASETMAVTELPSLEIGSTVFDETFSRRETTDLEESALASFVTRTGIRADRALVVPIFEELLVFATDTDVGEFDEVDHRVCETLASAAAMALTNIDTVSQLRDREFERSQTAARFERFRSIEEKTRDVERSLLPANSREEVERIVCEKLAAIDGLRMAWIGEADLASNHVTPRAIGGDHDGYLESITVELDEADGEPAGRTAVSREPTVVDTVAGEDRARDASKSRREWSQAALEREFQSILSVPLATEEYVYGVLTLYADRPLAFDADVARSFVHLGERVARAINAVETKRALLSDAVTELEFSIPASDDPLVTIARRFDSRLEVQTVVPRTDDEWATFVLLSNETADSIFDPETHGPEHDAGDGRDAETGDENANRPFRLPPSIESIEPIADRDDGTLFALVGSGQTLPMTIAQYGGRLRTVAATDGQTRVLVDVPQGSDVRSFVRLLERTYPDLELVARRERERSDEYGRPFEAELGRRLTDKQRRTLEAAYYSGFFEWPRERTGEEVASSLGISQPTFNRHFRTAERKLFTLLFDERWLDSHVTDDR